jgi:hypothetical protein
MTLFARARIPRTGLELVDPRRRKRRHLVFDVTAHIVISPIKRLDIVIPAGDKLSIYSGIPLTEILPVVNSGEPLALIREERSYTRRSDIGDVRLRRAQHASWYHDQPLVRAQRHPVRKARAVMRREVSSYDGDIAVVEPPDIRAVVIVTGSPEFFGGLSESALERRGRICFPRTGHGCLRRG